MQYFRLTLIAAVVAVLFVLMPQEAQAQACSFTTSGGTLVLNGNCQTTTPVLIPDGMTLDCQGSSITGIEDSAGDWVGGVVGNAGSMASVKNCTITVDSLANSCKAGEERLRGILFDGASGFISNNEVVGINKGASGCQEGNGIEVRNAPFDGTNPGTVIVDISNNKVFDYQKTGIVANGDVSAAIHNNQVGASATQENLAANSVQFGFGALGMLINNNIDGNQWKGTSFFAASAVLLFSSSAGVVVENNNIRGNSDVGLFVLADDMIAENNKIFEQGSDHPNSCCDIGIGNFGSDNTFLNNKVRGFEDNFGLGDTDKVIPSPNQQ